MGINTNKRRSAQLGMPHGTATARLRQNILFKLVQETGMDRCFVCGERIETVGDYSIEHKDPWLDVDPDLFWDLDNIAFSHRKCNRPNRPAGGGYHGPKFLCGTQGGYRNGCRCDSCRAWKSSDAKRWKK